MHVPLWPFFLLLLLHDCCISRSWPHAARQELYSLKQYPIGIIYIIWLNKGSCSLCFFVLVFFLSPTPGFQEKLGEAQLQPKGCGLCLLWIPHTHVLPSAAVWLTAASGLWTPQLRTAPTVSYPLKLCGLGQPQGCRMSLALPFLQPLFLIFSSFSPTLKFLHKRHVLALPNPSYVKLESNSLSPGDSWF